jgi:RHS repeat-associated protein
VTYPNGSSARYTYDEAHRVIRIDNLQNSALVSRFEYEYDENGNRTQQTETRGVVSEVTTYDFDPADRMLEVRYPESTTSYTYDAVGNRLTEQTLDTASTLVADRELDYDTRNQLGTITDHLNAAESVDYDYDANGNQTQKTKGGVATAFAYDIRDRLLSISQGATVLGRYAYDYHGLRVSKDVPGASTLRYLYDDDSVVLQTDTAGATVAKYDYGPDRLLSMGHAVEGRQFYLFDGLGSVSDLVRTDGALQASYKYDAWGENRGGVGASSSPFGFTGHERDETGLYYFKARFYDPDIGRFLSEDPAEGDFANPPSLQKYLYASVNPTKYVDPTGKDVEIIVGRPYRKPSGEWSPYGHTAIRVLDGSGRGRYDLAYDYGRYGKVWGLGGSQGEGILNIQRGSDYIARESRERDSVSYVIKTDEATDRRIMESFREKANEGTRRKDLERKLGYANSESYQLKEDYDAAPITGIGRSTCVTQSAEGCKVARDPKLDKIAKALDELYPKEVEKNLERLFENQGARWNPLAKKEKSPIAERRFYPKGQPTKPYVIIQEDHEKQIREDKEALKREEAEREKAWEEPKNVSDNQQQTRKDKDKDKEEQ